MSADDEKLLKPFREAVSKNDTKTALTLLNQLKLQLIQFQLVPPFSGDAATTRKQLTFAREVLELGTLVSIQAKDVKGFERHLAQLKVYYFDYEALLPPSERKWPILGVSLLGLLAHNRIAEFHTELELLSNAQQTTQQEIHNNMYIKYPIQLEQHLMEGSYNKILAARSSIPYAQYSFFLDILVETVREKIADCSERAYASFPLAEAGKLLMIGNDTELKQFINKRGWSVRDGVLYFSGAKQDDLSIPSLLTVKQTLEYATEIEKIV